jgi:hypothetical protein
LDYLTLDQIQEWEAYDRIDPIGKWRNEFGWASLQAEFRNTMTWAHGKRATKHTALDFMPEWDHIEPEEQPTQTVEEMKRVIENIAKSQNKKAYTPKKPPNTKKK